MMRSVILLLFLSATASALTVPIGLLSWNVTTGETTVIPIAANSLTDVTTGSNFQSFNALQLCSWESGGSTYQACGYWDHNSKLVLGKRTILPTRTAWTLYTYDGTGGLSDIARSGTDAHDGISVAIDSEGIIHVSYDHHVDDLNYRKSNAAITSWTGTLGSEISMTGSLESLVSYPMFVIDPVGKLRFFYRDGVSGNGDLIMKVYDTSTDTWGGQLKVVDGKSNVPDESPYWAPPVFSDDWNGAGTGYMYIVWAWRQTGSGSTIDNHDLAIVKYNGTIWEEMDGTDITLPITTANDDVIDALAIGNNLSSINAVTIDPDGNPHVIYGGTDGSDVYQIFHTWHNGSVWTRIALPGTSNVLTNLHSGYDVEVEADGTVHAIISSPLPQGEGLWRFSSDGDDYTSWTLAPIRQEHIQFIDVTVPGVSIRGDKLLWKDQKIFQALVPMKGSVEEDADMTDYSDWTGYATHSVSTNPSSDLYYTTLWISLNQLPADFWTNVGAAGFDIRAAKDAAGTQANWLPVDVIHFSDAGSSGTGLIAVGWWGTRASSGSQKVYIFAGNAGADDLDPGDSYGAYNAYPTQVHIVDPDGGGNNRAAPYGSSDSNITMTGAGSVSPGGASGPINGSKATGYNGTTQRYTCSATAAGGLTNGAVLGLMCVVNPDNTTAFHGLMGFANTGSNNELQILALAGTTDDFANFQTRGSATPETAASSAVFVSGSFQHVAGYALSADSRSVLINGGNKGTDTDNETPTSLNSFTIGGVDRVSDLWTAGNFSFTTFWQGMTGATLTDAQIGYEKEMLDDTDQSDFYGTWSWTSLGAGGVAPKVHFYQQQRQAKRIRVERDHYQLAP